MLNNIRSSALIGYTGFIGSNLINQFNFNDTYNSSNISDIKNKKYDLIVCAAMPGEKWKANLYPKEDLKALKKLTRNLSETTSKKIILISTVDVYPKPYQVNENSYIDKSKLLPYGKHRLHLEKFVKKKFEKHIIVRLPGLFGKNLKKNFIYDLIHEKNITLTHSESVFQFYNLEHLWEDIIKSYAQNIHLINFATEPISIKELVVYCTGQNFSNQTDKSPLKYDMRTIYALSLGKKNRYYLYKKEKILKEMKSFINHKKNKL